MEGWIGWRWVRKDVIGPFGPAVGSRRPGRVFWILEAHRLMLGSHNIERRSMHLVNVAYNHNKHYEHVKTS